MASEKVYVGKAGAQELYRKVKGDIGSLSDTVDGKLALKADQATLDAAMDSVNEALATKASTSDLESAVSELGQRIDTKADADTVESELALKADQSTLESAVSDLGQRIDTKADADTVESELALKADQSTLDANMASVNAALATKASTSDLESAVSDLGQQIDTKADADTVESELALKEDLANKVTSFGGQPTNVQYPSALLVKTEIDRLQQEIANLGGFEVVTTLVDGHPNPAIPSHKIIYLYKDPDGPAADPYTEWIYTVDDEWDVIGTTYVDLTPYYTSAQVDSRLATKVDTIPGKGLSTEDYTTADKNKLAGISNYVESASVSGRTLTLTPKTGEAVTFSDTGDVNVIEGITVNGTAVEPDENKNVEIVIPKAVPDPSAQNQMLFSTDGMSWAPVTWEFVQFATIGGQDYPTVKIGNQEWLGYNLDMKFAGLVVGDTSGATTTELRGNYYNNDETTNGWGGKRYGLLYNWIAASYMNSNRATLFPGWHVPTAADIDELATYLGTTAAGTKLKSTSGWVSGNGDGSTEFNGMPVGYYYGTTFSAEGMMTFYWTSESAPDEQAKYWQLTPGPAVYTGSLDKDIQCSIRLVKDSV